MSVPPLVPIEDNVSGLVGWQATYVPGKFSGFSYGANWQCGVDFAGKDGVLLYHCVPVPPYGTADLFRVSENRQFLLSPYAMTPEKLNAFLTLAGLEDVINILSFKFWKERLANMVVINIQKQGDDERWWIRFGQGDGKHDFFLGYVNHGLELWYADGHTIATDADLREPGKRLFRFDAHGHLWLRGIVKENTLS